MELPNKKELNQLDFLNNEIKNNDHEKPNFLSQSISNPKVNNNSKKIENILILDTETTGLDENKDEIIEIGCILFHVNSKPVVSVSRIKIFSIFLFSLFTLEFEIDLFKFLGISLT